MAKFQQRIIDNNDAAKQRLRIVLDMMNGGRPANNVEVKNLIDTNNDLITLG